MSNSASEEKLIRNELVVRSKNVSIKNAIINYFHKDPDVKATPLKFNCECSSLDCNKHIKTSIETYEKTHKRRDRFMIFKGHATPAVETVVANETSYQVVEKAKLAP